MTWTSDDLTANLPAVRKAASKGLEKDVLSKDKAFNEIIVLETTAGDFTKYVRFDLESATAAEPNTKEVKAQLDGVWQLEYSMRVGLGQRVRPDFNKQILDEVTTWATTVRLSERAWVLTRLCIEPDWHSTALDPKSLRNERVILLDPAQEARFEHVTTKWVGDHPHPDLVWQRPTVVIVYQDKDPRPLVSRLEDFALSCHLDGGSLHSTLTAKVRLRDFDTGLRFQSVKR